MIILDKITAFFLSILAFFGGLFGFSDAPEIDLLRYEIHGNPYECTGNSLIRIHDPSLFKAEDGTYYIYGSHISSAKSKNLLDWEMISAGTFDENRTLVPEGSTLRDSLAEAFKWSDTVQRENKAELYESIKTAIENGEIPELNGWETNVWASDVFFNKAMGKYCYYASVSVWGSPRSAIFFATSDSPEGTFEFQKVILYSGETRRRTFGKYTNSLNYNYTNIPSLIENKEFTRFEFETASHFSGKGKYSYEPGIAPNCIDPHPFYDKDGNLWLNYGSWSGGIYCIPLVEETGMPDYKATAADKKSNIYYGRFIAYSNLDNDGSGEGAYIVYDEKSDYYYLFDTFGGLGRLDGYNMREYRSKSPNGPFLDKMGNDAAQNVNTGLKINGNYKFSTDKKAFFSGGHNSVMIDDDGKIFNCFHTRFSGNDGGYFETVIHRMERTRDGWLTMLPLKYDGESADVISKNEIVGNFELVDFGSITIKGENQDAITSPTRIVSFNDDGTISGFVDYEPTVSNAKNGGRKVDGTWTLSDNSCFVSVKFGQTNYDGVAVKATDGRIMLSLAGDDNSTIWALSTK